MAVVKKISELTPKGANLANNDLLIVGVSNGTDYDLKSVTGAELLSTAVSQTITNGVTTTAPSQDAVYDALQNKVDKVTGSRLITSAEGTILSNTSGTNTGDETSTTIKSKLGITTLSGSNTGDQDLSSYAQTSQVVTLTGNQTVVGVKTFTNETKLNDKLYLKETVTPASLTGYTTLTSNGNQIVLQNGSSTGAATLQFNGAGTYTFPASNGTLATTSDLTTKVDANSAITGATKTKITYDSKGLVTAGADATTADIADSTNKRYVTDTEKTNINYLNTVTSNVQDQINAKVNLNSPLITPATKTKISYDAKGLVLSGSDATTADIADSLNKRYVTDANLTTLNNTSGTNTGDQIISDATLTTSDITTNDVSITKHGFVPKAPNNITQFLRGDGTWATPASGSSGGIWGIANSSGVYTYYATWALAVAAATSGQVIELFADITISSGALTLKDGVNIQGNGHTLILNTGTHGFIDNAVAVNVIINNIVLSKTEAVDAGIIYLTNSSSKVGGNATINVGNATPQGILGSGNVWGFRIIGNGYPILINGGNPTIENVYINTTFSGYAIQYQNTPVMQINNCLVKSTGSGVKTLGDVNNTNIIVSGVGILIGGTGSINNINSKSSTSNAIQAGNNSIENSTFISNGNICVSFTSSTRAYNSYFYSNAEVVIIGAGNFYNCTLKTDIYYVTQGFTGQCIDCELINTYNSSIGRIAHEPSGASFIDCNMIVANSSVVPIYSASTPTVYLYGNSIKGTTNFKSAGIVNGQTNTADAQGNVILN